MIIYEQNEVKTYGILIINDYCLMKNLITEKSIKTWKKNNILLSSVSNEILNYLIFIIICNNNVISKMNLMSKMYVLGKKLIY